MAIMTLGEAEDLIDLSIQDINAKVTNLDDNDPVLDLYHREMTEDYYDKDSGLSGYGEASRMSEGVVIAGETPVQTFDQTYTQVFFGKLSSFTLQSWKYGIKKRRLEGTLNDVLASVRRRRATLLTEYLEQSREGTTSYTVADGEGSYTKSVAGGDGLGFVHTAHTREDGGSAWNNEINDGSATNMDFAPDALRAAYRTASLIVDPKGNLMNLELDTVVCRKGSSVFFDAMEINGALNRGSAPRSTERDGNPFGAFKIVALPRQLSANAAYWWMFDSSMKNDKVGLQYRESQAPSLDAPDTDYKTKTISVTSTAAFDYGHNDARNGVGSDGTNS